MALGATLFALMNFFARLASSTASWASVASVRALVGALVAVAVARVRGTSLRATDRKAIFWRSFFGTLSMLATFYALSSRTLALGDTATLLNLTPVFLAILAPLFLRERTTGIVAIAIAISLAGVVLVLRPAILFGGESAPMLASAGPTARATAATATCAAFLASIAMMMLRRVGQNESAEAIAFHFSIFAAVALGILALLDPRLPRASDAGLMIAAGACGGVAQLAMTRAYSLESAARVGGVGYLSVVVSALLGVVILHEPLSGIAIGGMALVIVGGLVAAFGREASSV
jgi:drug/metabolite transporter (DMT)-like permease